MSLLCVFRHRVWAVCIDELSANVAVVSCLTSCGHMLVFTNAPVWAWRLGTSFAALPIRRRVCRHVILPSDISKAMPKGRLLSEAEWRGLGVQQSRGWEHYAIHRPEPHILLFRRDKNGNY